MVAAVSKEQPQDLTRRSRLMALVAWIERMPQCRVSVRPFCPDHPDTLMESGKTVNGQTHYYCPHATCSQSIKATARVV